jgi:hypothetical protein
MKFLLSCCLVILAALAQAQKPYFFNESTGKATAGC